MTVTLVAKQPLAQPAAQFIVQEIAREDDVEHFQGLSGNGRQLVEVDRGKQEQDARRQRMGFSIDYMAAGARDDEG